MRDEAISCARESSVPTMVIISTTMIGSRDSRVRAIVADSFLREAALENAVVGSIMGLRAMYMYGVLLPADAEGMHFHVGCCGFSASVAAVRVRPTRSLPARTGP